MCRTLLALLTLLPLFLTPSTANAEAQCCGFFIRGTLFNDLNGNGIQEGPENGLAGWQVDAWDPVGSTLMASTTTDAAGDYEFETPVWCGTTGRISASPQTGYVQTYPLSPGYHEFPMGGCGTNYEDIDFGFTTFGGCFNYEKLYTLDGDFNLGDLNGAVAQSDQVELTPTPTTFGFAWIANTDQGTLSKIDTATGNELARYRTAPASFVGASPSRTAIDKDGNCWVANRGFGGQTTIVQVLATGGIDRNTDTVIQTSADISGNGIIEPGEMLAYGDDERVARVYGVGDASADNLGRALAFDKSGFLWVGLYNGGRVVKLDPNLSTVTYFPNPSGFVSPPELASVTTGPTDRPYGLALSPNGNLYMATLGQNIVEIDPGLASGGTSAGPAVTQYVKHAGWTNYGIAVDKDCVVWVAMAAIPGGYGCVRWDPSVGFGDPSLGWSYSDIGATGGGRGITVDFNGDIWMAENYHGPGTVDGAARYSPTDPPTFIANYSTTTTTPVGVGDTGNGMMLVGKLGLENWELLDTGTGAPIPLPGPQLGGPGPYTYSDFTGSLFQITNAQSGQWTVISDASLPAMEWYEISWTPVLPAGTSVTVEARSANSVGALASQLYVPVPVSGTLTTPLPGQYLETRVTLTRNVECGVPWVTPVLEDLLVKARCECLLGPTQEWIQPCESGLGTVVNYLEPSLPDHCANAQPVYCDPPSGSLFPIGTTLVNCWTINADGDTVTASFPITITDDCVMATTGGCCIDGNCNTMSEADCEALQGIWLGDGSDCIGGDCDFVCTKPPRRLIAWLPLDNAPGGLTPNLANFGGPGSASTVGTPVPVIGQYVNNAYSFQVADAADGFVLPDANEIEVWGFDFSVDLWIKTTGVAKGDAPILDKRQEINGAMRGWALSLSGGKPKVEIGTLSGSMSYVAPTAINDGQWHLVAFTVDRNSANGLRVYVDGVLSGSPGDPTPAIGNTATAADLRIAHSNSLFGNPVSYFGGSLDEIEIFRRVLTAGEIAELYAVGQTGKCREACHAPQAINVCANGGVVNTNITICNYDSVDHLYSWGLSGTSSGFTTAATGFSPSNGSINVPAGTCVDIPITMTVPTGMGNGQTAGMQLTVFNHDSGALFGCVGSVKKNKWWCINWAKPDQGPKMPAVLPVHPQTPVQGIIALKHIGPLTPGTVFDYQLKAMSEDGRVAADHVSINGSEPGEVFYGEITVQGDEAEIPFQIAFSEHRPLQFERLELWADDDMDFVPELIAWQPMRSTLNSVTGVEDEIPSPEGTAFRSAPNPFNPSTALSFVIPGKGAQPVTLTVFNLQGRKIREIYQAEPLAAGLHHYEWDGADKNGNKLASGVYLVQLVMPGHSETIKVALVK